MFAYLPNVAAAVLPVVVGTSVSQFAGRTVTLAAEESGIEFARSLGSLVSGLILFIVGIMATPHHYQRSNSAVELHRFFTPRSLVTS